MARFVPPAVRSASGVNARNRFYSYSPGLHNIFKRGTGEQPREAGRCADCASYTDSLTGLIESAGDF